MQGGIMLELVLNCLIILIVLCGVAIVVNKLKEEAKDTVHNAVRKPGGKIAIAIWLAVLLAASYFAVNWIVRNVFVIRG